MGASSIATQMIIFIAVMVIAASMSVVFKSYMDDTMSSIQKQRVLLKDQLESQVKIEMIKFNNYTNTTTLWVRNTGLTRIKPTQVDLYIDNYRIAHDGNYSSDMVADTDAKNVGIWDENELLRVNVTNYFLETNQTHTANIMLWNGVSATQEFSY